MIHHITEDEFTYILELLGRMTTALEKLAEEPKEDRKEPQIKGFGGDAK